jgi:hypothetical protein
MLGNKKSLVGITQEKIVGDLIFESLVLPKITAVL